MADITEYVSVPDAAAALERSRTLVFKLGKAGDLVLEEHFGIKLVTRASLDRLLMVRRAEAELARRKRKTAGQ